ncbi:hypothetical protein D3C83_78250 [compost metagenome]
MRIDAALADQPQLVEPIEQGRADFRALAYQHQRLGIFQPLRERFDVLNVIVPDFNFMPAHFAETLQGADGVVIIVEYGDLHGYFPRRRCQGCGCPAALTRKV